MSTTTTGSASPSLSPLSMLSNWRSRAGTSVLVTIAEANTGSVGLSTAPTRKAVTQSSPATKWASTEMPRNVSGIPSSKARPDSRHAARNSGTPARWPSVNSTVNRARSASVDTIGLFGVSCSQPKPPEPATAPASRNISDVDSTVRAASPDTRTTMSSATPKMRTSAMYCALPGPRESRPAVSRTTRRQPKATGDRAYPPRTGPLTAAAADIVSASEDGPPRRVAAAVTFRLGQRWCTRRAGWSPSQARLLPPPSPPHPTRPISWLLSHPLPIAAGTQNRHLTTGGGGATEHPGLRRLLDIPRGRHVG